MFQEFYNQYFRHIQAVKRLFAVGLALGAAAAFYYPQGMEQIAASFTDRFGDSPALDANLAWAIFLQNLMVSALAWMGGLAFGLLPGIIVLANGAILGYVITYVILTTWPHIWGSLLLLGIGLVPHGIIEIPAFLAAAVLGLALGLDWVGNAARGQRWAVLKVSVLQSGRYFVLIMFALAIAAIIEVFISGKLVNNF